MIQRKTIPTIMIAGLLLLVIACAQALTRDSENRIGVSKPLVTWSGRNSEIEEPLFLRITEQDAFTDLWLKHMGVEPGKFRHGDGSYDYYYNPANRPEVDFDTCMVIALFQGTKTNCAGLRAAHIREEEDCIRFGFGNKWYSTIATDEDDDMPIDSPFGIFVIPASHKPIVIEEEMLRGKRDRNPDWKERARL